MSAAPITSEALDRLRQRLAERERPIMWTSSTMEEVLARLALVEKAGADDPGPGLALLGFVLELREYADHGADCTSRSTPGPCSCGLSSLLASIEDWVGE